MSAVCDASQAARTYIICCAPLNDMNALYKKYAVVQSMSAHSANGRIIGAIITV